jgi:RNA polymerase sigma factor for flagellar operon FliA
MKRKEEARTEAPRWKKPSKDEAYVRYAPLVKYVVDRIAANVPKYVERDDLLNAAALGLFDALEKYDAAKGTKFETYAVWRIRGAVLDELRSMDWASRSVRRKARQLESVCRELDQRLGRQATEQEIASEMEVSSNQFGRILDEVRGVVLLSLNQPASENEETGAGGLAELIEDTRVQNALESIEKDELKEVLLDVFNGLLEQEKLVLALYYYEEMTLKEIGETLGISESRASQIHTKAIGRVRRRLAKVLSVGQ